MKFKIGFTSDSYGKPQEDGTHPTVPAAVIPRKSVVQVMFPGCGSSLAYYNDRFDLKAGDLVYVDGKLEGRRGRVTEVNYNFKIKRSDYKQVIALIDTSVKGQFHFAGSHFVTFDRHVIPFQKVVQWFKAPSREEDVFISGSDDTSFMLNDLKGMKVSSAIAERGHDYYMENKVVYISIDGTHGHAIVEGSEAYEVEFEYRNGEISHLTCSCFCSGSCKHEFAAMLQLRETLDAIQADFAEQYRQSGYFAAMFKSTLLCFAVTDKDSGSLTLG
ncbi:MAG: hypothetical protein IJP02_04950 [Oscillospiraceae bacterium]|nr:hypothetical protein [Oscillospiraceae bacterium]